MNGRCSLASWSRGLWAPLRPYAETLVRATGLRVTSVRRSYTEQLRLWNNRANNPYPVAYPGTSKHELGYAWDMVGPPAMLARAGAIWESWGGRWGGRVGDPIHFEV